MLRRHETTSGGAGGPPQRGVSGRRLWLAGIAVAAGCAVEPAVLEIADLDDQTAQVGETLQIEVPVHNPAGVILSFSFEGPSLPGSDAAIYSLGAGGLFRWRPLVSHVGSHLFTFRVDGGGTSDTESIRIDVVSDIAPVFIQPGAGGTYDLSRDSSVIVHVLVKDEDSTSDQVRIRERPPGIAGAVITARGKEAEWQWRPSRAQVEASDRYTLALEAEDESHSPVHHDYIIVLRGAGREDCPGTPPQIVSAAPPPPDVVETSLDYRIEATVRDDSGLKDLPILYYSTEPPGDPSRPDVTAMRQTLFIPVGGDVFEAFIPNLGLSGAARATIYYVVSAADNDDVEGTACDHRTDSSLRQFDVMAGAGETTGYCARCSSDLQCASGACIAAPFPFCAGDCAACSPPASCRDVTTVAGRVLRRCAPPNLNCSSAGTCTTDDRFEDNDSWTAARAIAADVHGGLAICPGDEDYFYLTAATSGTLEVLIDGWNADTTDIDLQLLRADGAPLRTSAGIEAFETIAACVDAGRHGIRVWGFMNDSGPYDLTVDFTRGSCCADDALEDNDSFGAATRIPTAGTIMNGRICAGDEDWFVVWAEAGQRLSADLLIDGGDLDLELYDTDGLRRLAFSAGVTDSERVEADIGTSGSYYLRVFGYRGAEGDYMLEHRVAAGGGCRSSLDCPWGTVCDGRACIDDACTPGSSTCPSGTFCPPTGGAGGPSDCVDPCSSSSECRAGYACKLFPAGGGCAQAGSGAAGAACASFRACAGNRTCLTWPGGYCAREGCTSNAECGTGAWCVRVDGASLGTCLRDCLWNDDECRLSAGYRCRCARDVAGAMQWICLPAASSGPSC